MKTTILNYMCVGVIYLLVKPLKSVASIFFELDVPATTEEIVLDPHEMEDVDSMMVNRQIHRGLFRFTSEGSFSADIAESWRFSHDETSLSVELKKQIFSNGSPILARHVVNTFARLFLLESPMSSDLSAIKGIAQFRKSRKISDLGIRADGEYKVTFEFSRKHAIILKLLAAVDCGVLYLNSADEKFKVSKNTPLSGSYRIYEKEKGYLVLEKWRADDLDSPSPPQRIRIHTGVVNPILQSKDSKLDTLDRQVLSSEEQDWFLKNGWNKAITELTTERMLILNPKRVDSKMRATIAKAVDTKKIATGLGSEYFQPAFGIIPTGVMGSISKPIKEKNSFVFDESKTITHLSILAEDSLMNRRVFKILSEQLSKHKMVLKVEWVTKKNWLQKLLKGDFETTIASKGLDYFDGYSVLSYFRSGFDSNVFFINDSKIDSMLDEVVSIQDENIRTKKYSEIQEKILSHKTVIPLVFGSNASGLWSPETKKVPPHPGGIQNLPFQSIEMKTVPRK
jgi:ABC-type oligopeptide transport system substrate-binding subunit